ncbi:MAG: flagellar hook-associated protein FlgK, partial [Planctomycetaceae bacterium]|nr:flagellar hook-associated protein FlgK [Planctomycetaceae bacterium]
MGLNATLYTAGRSLELFTAGIQVAGQNVANANTPGYVRENLNISTNLPYESGGMIFGTGAQENGIRQQLDYHLEQQIHQANADVYGSEARNQAYAEVQLILSELTSGDLSSLMNEFTGAISEVVNQPELIPNRQVVLQQGAQLAEAIQTMREQIDRSRVSENVKVEGLVEEVNELVDEIAKLNTQIVRLEAGGLHRSQAGGLRSLRLEALNRLSQIMPIQTQEKDNGIIDVTIGSNNLVVNSHAQHLEVFHVADRNIPVSNYRFSDTKALFTTTDGEIGGAIEARDGILGTFSDQLETYTQALIEQVNRIHASGEGVIGYESITATNGMDDTSVALNQAGLMFNPDHGGFEIKVYDRATDTTTTSYIQIDLDGLGGNDTSLDDLQASLDAIDHLSASIDQQGRLSINADNGYEIKFHNDTSGTLAALGINTFFQGVNSLGIAVNETLNSDPRLFAAGLGEGPGDNRNALELANFVELPSEKLKGVSLDDFYTNVASQIANSANAESALSVGFNAYKDSLNGLRLQNSGVSLDEEAIHILELQQGFAAAARIVSTV